MSDIERDKRLRKTYGITLEQYNQILAAQDGKCAVCGHPATDFTVSLNVDHKHFKIQTRRFNPGEVFDPRYKWQAFTQIDTTHYSTGGITKQEAIDRLRKHVMPHSVRGLLCPGRYSGCNRLMGRIDKIEWLEKVLSYLKNPPARQIIS